MEKHIFLRVFFDAKIKMEKHFRHPFKAYTHYINLKVPPNLNLIKLVRVSLLPKINSPEKVI